MRNILFLDIDGVLNPKWWVRKVSVDSYGCAFAPECVVNLEKIIEETGADIVISSSWKCIGLVKIKKMWEDRKLPGNIIDVTPDVISDELLLNTELASIEQLYNRGCEIKGWLMQHKDEDIQYVIIDDMDDILPEQQPRFVQTDPEIGLSEKNATDVNLLFKSVTGTCPLS